MRLILTLAVAAALSGCSQARRYELHGQILAVDAARQEITIKHEDIRGFMPGMTMPFKVRDPRLLQGRTAGDLVTATLVVEDSIGYLEAVERTGHAELREAPPSLPRIDLLSAGDVPPDVRLIDETGTSRSLRDWRG